MVTSISFIVSFWIVGFRAEFLALAAANDPGSRAELLPYRFGAIQTCVFEAACLARTKTPVAYPPVAVAVFEKEF